MVHGKLNQGSTAESSTCDHFCPGRMTLAAVHIRCQRTSQKGQLKMICSGCAGVAAAAAVGSAGGTRTPACEAQVQAAGETDRA